MSAAIISCCDTAPVFELCEHVFDFVALFVEGGCSPQSKATKVVKDMREEGIDAKFTEYKSKAHYIWDEVYREDDLWDWMMAQRR